MGERTPSGPDGERPALQVRFLGCGDSFGSGGRHQPCIQVDTPGSRVLLDCGASAMIAMAQQGIAPNSIDVILVSHLHGDHCGGVPFVLMHAMLAGRRERPLTVVGPVGSRDRLAEMREILFPGSSVMVPRFAYEVVEIAPGTPLALRDFTVTARRAVHTPQTLPLMLRFECAGRVIAYTGDTAWTDELPDTARGADLLISECYFFDKRIPMHMTYATLREHRHAIDARRIVLTHLSEDMLQHVHDVTETVAFDGMVLDV